MTFSMILPGCVFGPDVLAVVANAGCSIETEVGVSSLQLRRNRDVMPHRSTPAGAARRIRPLIWGMEIRSCRARRAAARLAFAPQEMTFLCGVVANSRRSLAVCNRLLDFPGNHGRREIEKRQLICYIGSKLQ